MNKESFEDIRSSGRLLYEYIRGSKAYGIDRPESDEDRGGVYMEPLQELLGIPSSQREVSDEKNDTVWYSFGRFIELLKSSNPNIIEALFIPDRCIIYESPIITELKRYRDSFVTKRCFHPFMGYSVQQLKKARSLGKKVAMPRKLKKPTVLDSVFTFKDQGSTKIEDFLSNRGLDQKYCGLVNIPNCTNNYHCFYDWGQHIKDQLPVSEFIKEVIGDTVPSPLGYRGIVGPESNQLRLSSVQKGALPICTISFDINAYTQRCVKYREWKNWLSVRNEERYQEVLDNKGYDCKNATHCLRLMTMGIEIAKGQGVKVDRSGIDSDFLKSVRSGKVTFEEIMNILESKKEEMEQAMAASQIPDDLDQEWLGELVYNLRKQFYNIL